MKRIKRPGAMWLPVILLVAVTEIGSAQRDKSYILEHTNRAELLHDFEVKRQIHEQKLDSARALAIRKGWSTFNLIGLDTSGMPIYEAPQNTWAADITKVLLTRNVFDVDGDGILIGMWEAFEDENNQDYAPRESHIDFTWPTGITRIVNPASSQHWSDHATAVAGTLIGSSADTIGPGNPLWSPNGMAIKAQVEPYSSPYAHIDVAMAAANGLLLSNHSYSVIAGYSKSGSNKWSYYGGQFEAGADDSAFGNYGEGSCSEWDDVMRNAPFHLPVFSSGNNHDDNPQSGHLVKRWYEEPSEYEQWDPSLHPLGDGDQICTIAGSGIAKNVLTVGSMDKVPLPHPISSFSSRGPTDDGRMKPDLCGIGQEMLTASADSDESRQFASGTSFSAPNVTGALALLQELYNEKHVGTAYYMRNSTLKGLILHTADDYGTPGPDYTFGWGLLDAFEAALIVNEDAWQGPSPSTARMIEDEFIDASTSHTKQYGLRSSTYANTPLTITLCYNDFPGNGLQNDLDIEIESLIDGAIYRPYVLNPANPASAATTGDNDLDNIEQIYFVPAGAQIGNQFTLTVSIESLNSDPDNLASVPFSLIITGLDGLCRYNIVHDQTVQPAFDTYTAENNIISAIDVISGGSMVYRAGGKITLQPGFKVEAGGVFSARNGTCN